MVYNYVKFMLWVSLVTTQYFTSRKATGPHFAAPASYRCKDNSNHRQDKKIIYFFAIYSYCLPHGWLRKGRIAGYEQITDFC